jgi:LysM repeat protein
VKSDGWQRYAAPAAFLLAVTIAVALVRAGFESGHGSKQPAIATTTRPVHTATTVPTTTAPARPKVTKQFVTVQAGDTFSVIASRTHVPVATIEKLNPKVASTTLHIGEQIRIK